MIRKNFSIQQISDLITELKQKGFTMEQIYKIIMEEV